MTMLLDSDVVVVGSGPGGATIARELVRRGRRVLLLERGIDERRRFYYGTYLGALLYTDRASLLFTEEGLNVVRPLMLGGATSMYAGALAVSGRALALAAGLALLLHAGLWGAGRRRGGSRGGAGRATSPRSIRAALRDIERAGKEATSKEQAAGLVEKALHEAFGAIPDEDESERARAVRALLDDARFVRYKPQLGDYTDNVEDLVARAAEAVRRWA